jgi:hypothetical protein
MRHLDAGRSMTDRNHRFKWEGEFPIMETLKYTSGIPDAISQYARRSGARRL